VSASYIHCGDRLEYKLLSKSVFPDRAHKRKELQSKQFLFFISISNLSRKPLQRLGKTFHCAQAILVMLNHTVSQALKKNGLFKLFTSQSAMSQTSEKLCNRVQGPFLKSHMCHLTEERQGNLLLLQIFSDERSKLL
jgi:hypothetical protein